MAKYYTRISLDRMSHLLELSREETEEFLSSMVVKGTVEAKTDRLEGIVNFQKTQVNINLPILLNMATSFTLLHHNCRILTKC